MAARKAKAETRSTKSGIIIPHWNAPFGSTTVVRLLPDANQSNPLPWVEKFVITLPFTGMVNSDNDTDQPVSVKVVSPVTFGKKCPVTEAIRPFWKGGDDEKAIARTYYRKASYIYAALAVSLPFSEENAPENPIRTLHLNRQIQDVVSTYLANPELEYAPYDPHNGRDLRIVKKQVGSWANYTASNFSLKERALSTAEQEAIEKFGLRDLSQDLGTPPTDAEIDMMHQMYVASLAGEPFDNARWGTKFRAFGHGGASSAAPGNPTSSTTASTITAASLRPKATTTAEAA